jgi:hypothetical protein
LIDRMPPTQLSGLVQFLQTLLDPVTVALRNAPLDNAPYSEAEQTAAESHAWLQPRGSRAIPHDEAVRRLGLE